MGMEREELPGPWLGTIPGDWPLAECSPPCPKSSEPALEVVVRKPQARQNGEQRQLPAEEILCSGLGREGQWALGEGKASELCFCQPLPVSLQRGAQPPDLQK